MTSILQYVSTMVAYLRLMTMSDFVDIVILTLVLYKGIALLQRTNALNVARALLLIVAAMWLSHQLNLDAINFVLRKAVELGLLALVIIFQPEIRRFLERIGSSSGGSQRGLFSFLKSTTSAPAGEVEKTIQETVEAYGEMSKNKVGALMVFEREADLSNIISSGTPFESSVTSELLKNIFYPKAPLHDGAVVVRDGKIVAAACMLPMSENMSLSKDLGMRHRAAMGMSERSDAVVAVVSEETGSISVMSGGNLRRHLSPETLGRILSKELLPQTDSSGRAYKLPFAQTKGGMGRMILNLILALIVSVGLWLYVVSVENPTGAARLRDVPITVQGEDSLEERGLMVSGMSQEGFDLRITGRKSTLMRINSENVTLNVDVSSIEKEGEWALNCKVQFPPNISAGAAESLSVSDWDELRVVVTIEEMGTKTVPVRGEFVGEIEEGYRTGFITTEPARVELTGPAQLLEKVEYAVAQVENSGARDTIVEPVHLTLTDRWGRIVEEESISCSRETVEIMVPIRRVVETPLTLSLVDGENEVERNCEIEPASIFLLEREDPDAIPTTVSLGALDVNCDLTAGTWLLPVQTPESAAQWGGPRFAAVTFPTREEIRQIAVRDIRLENVPEGCQAEIVSTTVYPWVRGLPAALRALDPTMCYGEVDLSGVTPGDKLQRLPVKLTIRGEGTELWGQRYTVALRLVRT